MRKFAILSMLVACALAFAAAGGAATGPATFVVDRDGVECANADFTSIQAAVDAAQAGDLIRVCPDLYSESVVVNKPLTLKADPDAVEAIDCFQPTLGELPADQQAIVDPAGDGFSVAFKLEADNAELAGFVVQGASVGIHASDRFSGHRVHHNLIRQNALFGMDFGSEGTSESRVDHNCIRNNPFGLVSELDDDSLWKQSDGPERDEWNARNLINARINHNFSFANSGGGLEAAGPGRRVRVTFDHNISRDAILLQNSTDSAIVENEVMGSPGNAIVIGGGNDGLLVRGNHVNGAALAGVRFDERFIDRFRIPSQNVVVAQNAVATSMAGILSSPNNLADSLISENITSENRGNGINLFSGNTRNVVSGNQADNNGIAGINVFSGATGNRFEQNSMHGNTIADARDFNPPGSNLWINNDCGTDNQNGLICGIG